MEVREAVLAIGSNETEEIFLRARDRKHGESMRVIAYKFRQTMPAVLNTDVGIQLLEEKGIFFLRLFNRNIDGENIFVRDKESGELVPLSRSNSEGIVDAETTRMIRLMREDGKTEEEIKEFLKGE